MYLISIYFDEKTEKLMQNYIKQVADKTGNLFMIDGKVPPHITIAAFESKDETIAMQVFQKCTQKMWQDTLQWVSVATFLPYVIYLAPVLNRYLHDLVSICDEELGRYRDVKISSKYRPFHWMPHTTIGKTLSQEQLQTAFQELTKQFAPFSGTVVRVGLAKTNPYREIEEVILKSKIGKEY